MGDESKHHNLGPSKYPVWAVCPCAEFGSGETKESLEGSSVHEQLQMDLDGIETAEDYRARWAADWVREASGGVAVATETKVGGVIIGLGHGKIFGTVDVMWKDADGVTHIADFKTFAVSGEEYLPQLRGYATLWALSNNAGYTEKIILHVLCGGSLSVTTEEAEAQYCYKKTYAILERHDNATDADAHANSKCKYCTKCGSCKACADAAGALVADSPRALFGHMHLAKKLEFVQMVEKVIEGIKKAAKEEAERNGGVLEGDGVRYELTPSSSYKPKDMASMLDDMNFNKQFMGTKRGKEYTVDVAVPDAYEFVGKCNISRTALAELIAEKNPGMTKKDATEWTTQFYDKIVGEPKLVKAKIKEECK